MGAGQTKDELLYNAVQNGNPNAVKSLHRDGASLEWVDKEGRTPLILACTRGDLFDMIILLLSLGANANVYRPGAHGGFPLHHAAKRGLDKTVLLLLRHGADPLAINDDTLTPLDMARAREHVTVVRIIEDKICLFNGIVRELSGPGFLEVIVPQWVTKKVWVVVLPAETPDPRRPPKFDVVIYQSPKVAVPRAVIHLAKCDVEEPKFDTTAPLLMITDRTTKTKHKFLPEYEGDKAQLERFWMACKGIPQARIPAQSPRPLVPGVQMYGPGLPSPVQAQEPIKSSDSPRPAAPAPSPGQKKPSKVSKPAKRLSGGQLPEDVAYAMAIDASIRTASEEGVLLSPSARQQSGDSNGWGDSSAESSYKGWGPSEQEKGSPAMDVAYGDWEADRQTTHHGWGSPEAEPSRRGSGDSLANDPATSQLEPPLPRPLDSDNSRIYNLAADPPSLSSPSAPPLPTNYMPPGTVYDGPIHYPSIDTSPLEVHYPSTASSAEKVNEIDKKAMAVRQDPVVGQCVVCWDAPAQGVCIPCGHLAGCMDCLLEIKEKSWGCPVCRAPLNQIVKVFQV
eukprot:TRINITY_DN13813_c0_g1_i2.p1 TRINITY_DN13813_c0_g1~~TRINITY_DN13813_c0_g1_i2.p1  ORF type:complete len:565 (-),score=70.18 TRINITY_DN13813_c0_g1_i2:683-2377(-)